MAYNFDENILKVSKTKEIFKLPDEWVSFLKERKEDGHCICGARIKNVEYFVNIFNWNVIQAGTGCRDKLTVRVSTRNLNAILKEFIYGFRVEYTNIINLLSYCEESRKRMVNLINTRIDSSSVVSILKNILKDLEELVGLHKENNVDFQYISELLEKVTLKLEGIEKKENEEKEKRAKIEKEEREKKEKMEEIKRERKRQIERRNNEMRAKWEQEEKEIAIEREKILREQYMQRQKIVDEEREEKEREDDLKKKTREDFWNRFK